MSRRPVIGICASVERARWTYWDEEAAVLSMNYVRQVQEAGGIPVVLAPDPHPEQIPITGRRLTAARSP